MKSEDYYVSRHLFVEQDARPLYAWPEKDVDGRSDRKRRIREVWDCDRVNIFDSPLVC